MLIQKVQNKIIIRFLYLATFEFLKHLNEKTNQTYLYQDIIYIDDILDYVSGGELFTHLYQREKFKESEVRIYIAEIVLALQHLHKVTQHQTTYW